MRVDREQEFRNAAETLERHLKESRAEIADLKLKIAAADRIRQGYLEQAKAAAAEAKAIQVDRDRLLALRSVEFEPVIRQLFQKPSRQSSLLTLAVALGSIVCGAVISNQSDTKSAEALSNLESKMTAQVSQVSQLEDDMSAEIKKGDAIIKGLDDRIPKKDELAALGAQVVKHVATDEENIYQVLSKLDESAVVNSNCPRRFLLPAKTFVSLPSTKQTYCYYKIQIPSGSSALSVSLSNPNRDATLSVRYGETPTGLADSSWEWADNIRRVGDRSINLDKPRAGSWFVRVEGYDSSTDGKIWASY